MSEQDTQDTKFRTVNRILGAQPSLGPIPGNQIVPWCVILLFSYLVGNTFQLGWLKTGFLAIWLMSTWWILTWRNPWRFLSKFVSTPTITMGYARYHSILNRQIHERKGRKKNPKGRR